MLLEMTLAALVLIGGATAFIFGLAGSLPDERKVKREIATKRVMRISSLIDGAPAAIRGNVVAGREGLVTANTWWWESLQDDPRFKRLVAAGR